MASHHPAATEHFVSIIEDRRLSGRHSTLWSFELDDGFIGATAHGVHTAGNSGVAITNLYFRLEGLGRVLPALPVHAVDRELHRPDRIRNINGHIARHRVDR